MVLPIRAMAWVRFSSRVRSASRAVTAAEMAPAPCRARPTSTPIRVSALAAGKLPAAKMIRPKMITGLRPMRSEAMPKGIIRIAWVRP